MHNCGCVEFVCSVHRTLHGRLQWSWMVLYWNKLQASELLFRICILVFIVIHASNSCMSKRLATSPDSVCLCVCVCVRPIKPKWLKLKLPNLVHGYSITISHTPVNIRSKIKVTWSKNTERRSSCRWWVMTSVATKSWYNAIIIHWHTGRNLWHCVCNWSDICWLYYRCDAGFESSETCSVPDNHLSSMLVAPISSSEDLQMSFSTVEGAVVDYSCGVVSSGKAAVFNGPDRRVVETINLNTSTSR